MDIPGALATLWQRIQPDPAPAAGWWLLAALAVTAAAVAVPVLWRFTRPAVTIVHELGHAVVGVLFGRRFTGFVVSSDMSGHAVTVGPARGPGRIVSTWAGYPAPGLLGAVLVQIALAGWGRTALFAALVALAVSLLFSRSVHTVLAVLGTGGAVGAIWWWGGAGPIALLTLAAGAFLLLGAWRHLGAVISSGRRGDDPAQLAQLTAVPAGVWSASFALVLAACTLWAGAVLAGPLGDLL